MAQGDSDDSSDTGLTAASRAHPQDIVVAPLNIDTVIIHQAIDNTMCTWTTIVYITHDMEVIDGQALNRLGHDDDY